MSSDFSRREVLAASLAVPAIRLPLPTEGPVRLAYFSDTHVGLGRNISENEAMLREIARLVQPRLALNVGDVVDYGWPGEFDAYAKLEPIVGCPVFRVPGNHDVRWSPQGTKLFRERLGPTFQATEQFGVLWVSLDSSVPLSHWGHYEAEQLRWLERVLKKAGRSLPVVIATHHWVGRDRVMIDNEDDLLRLIEPYNVKAILTGHGHSDLRWEWNGILALMNRGLYQGSYTALTLEPNGEFLEFARRTTERPELAPLASIPLRVQPRSRPLWQVPLALSTTATLQPDAPQAREFRWNSGDFAPIPGPGIPAPETAGDHTLSLREGAQGRLQPFVVRFSKPESKLKVTWETELTGGVMSHLHLDRRGLWVSAMDGSIYLLDPRNGTVRWRERTDGYCHSSPVVDGDLVIVGSADAHVYALDADTGRVQWRFQTQGPVYASAAVVGETVTIASGDGKVYGLHRGTGRLLWTWELPPSNTAFVQSRAATDGQRVFLGAWDKNLYALDSDTGREVWRQACTARTFAFSPAIGGPAVAPGHILVPANGNELYAFAPETGKLLWKQSAPGDKFGHSSPRVVRGRVVVGGLGDRGEVHCLRLADGAFAWTTPTGSVIYDSSPAVSQGRVAIGSVDGTLSVLDLVSGALLAQHRVGVGHFLSSPSMEGRRIYAATFANRAVCLEFLG